MARKQVRMTGGANFALSMYCSVNKIKHPSRKHKALRDFIDAGLLIEYEFENKVYICLGLK